MIISFVNLIVAAIIVEAVVFVIFSFPPVKLFNKSFIANFPFQIITAWIFGIGICFIAKIDILQMAFSIEPSYVGYAVSGIIISRGSNFVHDVINKIKDAQKDTPNA